MGMLSKEHSLPALADALEISTSGFHAQAQKAARPRKIEDAELRSILISCFTASRQTYGSPRLQRDLRDRGFFCGKNRVNRLMREAGLRPKQKRRYRPRTTDSRYTANPAENWLVKVPAPDRPGQVWQSDFTYVPTAEGWVFVAFTIDACSRRCVAHHVRDDMAAELVTTTLLNAIHRAPPPPGLIHHSDRGSQYASSVFQDHLKARHITPSMSRSGNPYDNALAESFVATLKAECFAGAIPPSKAAVRFMVFDYIETFYNTRRRHSSIGFVSPAVFEAACVPPSPQNRDLKRSTAK